MRWMLMLVALSMIGLSIWQFEAERAGLEFTPLEVEGDTPATLYATSYAGRAPPVVIARCFAGPRKLMEPFALTLAQAGYVVASFDFKGHGRNPHPMSGDIEAITGTTQRLMNETARVAEAVLEHPRADGRLAYLGHSMASDVIVRQALAEPAGDAVVAISMFSEAVSAAEPHILAAI